MQPLADQLRPKSLDDVVGQDHILGKMGVIWSAIDAKRPLSIILWGPPGVRDLLRPLLISRVRINCLKNVEPKVSYNLHHLEIFVSK